MFKESATWESPTYCIEKLFVVTTRRQACTQSDWLNVMSITKTNNSMFLQFSLLSSHLIKCPRSCHISTENQPIVLRELTAGLGCSNCRRNLGNSIPTGRTLWIPSCNTLSQYGGPSYLTWSTRSELANTPTQPLVFHSQLTSPGRSK